MAFSIKIALETNAHRKSRKGRNEKYDISRELLIQMYVLFI